jgi:predicted TIM-barrel enzyme
MAIRNQTPQRDSLVGYAVDGKIGTPVASRLIAPPIPRSSLTPLLSGLLPNRDHNDDLMRGLDRLPRGSAASQPLFAVFAADPFIEGKRIAYRLLGKGYKRIVNWPTTAQYGAKFSAELDSVNLGPRQEYEKLSSFAHRGLSISVAVCTEEAAPELTRLKPEFVFLAPTFALWVNGWMRSKDLLVRCAALADSTRGEVPIVLMATRGAVSLAQARRAGASALLIA